jgi:hypothetical protein
MALFGGIAVLAVSGLIVYVASSHDGSAPSHESGAPTGAQVEQGAESSTAQVVLSDNASPALMAFVSPQAENRLPTDLHYQIPEVTEPEDVNAVVAVLMNRDESDTIRHEAANLLHRSNYAELETVLIEALEHPEETERFRSWIVQHLFNAYENGAYTSPSRAQQVLVPLLEYGQPAVRREALLGLHRLDANDGPDVVSKAGEWLADAETVDLALRILRERNATDYLPQIRQILADEQASQPARIAAIVTVSAWNDDVSKPALEQISQLPDQPSNFRLRRSAKMALERMQ